MGRAHGRQLGQLARGIDDRPVEPDRAIKSVSHEETYPVDLYDRARVAPGDRENGRLGGQPAAPGRPGGPDGHLEGSLRRLRHPHPVAQRPGKPSDGPAIAARAVALLDGEDLSPGVRLLGVGVSNLTRRRGRPGSADAPRSRRAGRRAGTPAGDSWRDASRAVDAIRGRFGDGAVGPATLLGPEPCVASDSPAARRPAAGESERNPAMARVGVPLRTTDPLGRAGQDGRPAVHAMK